MIQYFEWKGLLIVRSFLFVHLGNIDTMETNPRGAL